MASLDVIKPGLYTSIQDLGRRGFAYYAIPRSGAMDFHSLTLANKIIGLAPESPAIEFNQLAATLRFHQDGFIVLTGADMHFTINDNRIPINRIIAVQEGDVLSGQYSSLGMRSYLQVNGQFKVDKSYNSASSYPPAGLGAMNGQILKKNDRLEWQEQTLRISKATSPPVQIRLNIKIYKGPEHNLLSKSDWENLKEMKFRILPESNRMGTRLSPDFKCTAYVNLSRSVPVLPGFIQLTPSGQLIVVLQDGQTTGGYPRIAFIKEKDLSEFNQLPLGKEFSFLI